MGIFKKIGNAIKVNAKNAGHSIKVNADNYMDSGVYKAAKGVATSILPGAGVAISTVENMMRNEGETDAAYKLRLQESVAAAAAAANLASGNPETTHFFANIVIWWESTTAWKKWSIVLALPVGIIGYIIYRKKYGKKNSSQNRNNRRR